MLETGSFGSVYVCSRDGQEFVLKKIPVESIEDANEAHEEAMTRTAVPWTVALLSLTLALVVPPGEKAARAQAS